MSLIEFEPVNRQSTAETIAERLREAVMRADLAPGAQLAETELATQFGVSRGPVREALQRLVSEGLFISIRHRGIFVIDLTPDDIDDIYQARTALESGALTLILTDRRQQAYQALLPTVTEMTRQAQRGDPVAVSDADQEFHTALVESAGSPRLVRAARTLLTETRMCLGVLQTTYPDLQAQAEEHRTLAQAIRSGPPHQAHKLLSQHMADALERMRQHYAHQANPQDPEVE